MGKVKQMAMDNAEKNVDLVVNDYIKNKIDFKTAKNKVLKVDNVDMTGIDELNVDEVLFTEKENYEKKTIQSELDFKNADVNNPDFEKYAGRYGKSVKEWKDKGDK